MSNYAEMIDRFEQGGAELRAALHGVTEEERLTRCEPGLWSIQEVVIHLVDSDAIAIDRMKRILTEDNPDLLNTDEGAYVDRLHCHEQSLDDALLLFETARRQFARVLRNLEPEQFERNGTHNVAGNVTLAGLIQTYTAHVPHHLKFVEGKLERLRGS